MIFVVEIENKHGAKATKEYDASSPYELLAIVSHELRHHPDCRPVGGWWKNRPEKPVYLS